MTHDTSPLICLTTSIFPTLLHLLLLFMFLIYQEHICNGGVGGVHVILCFISPLPKSTPEQIYSPTPDALSQPCADCPASPDLTVPHYF